MTTIATANLNTTRFSPRLKVTPAYDGQDMTALGVLLAPDRLPNTLNLRHVTVEGGYLLIQPGRDGVIFTAEGAPLAETLNFCGTYGLPTPNALRRDAAPLRRDVFVAVDAAWNNYYHWLAMALPKMLLWRGDAPIVVPETLTHMRFKKETWKQTVDTITAPITALRPNIYRAPAIHTLMLDNPEPAYLSCFPAFDESYEPIRASLPSTEPSRRILIERRDFDRLNPMQVAAVRSAGYTPIDLESMDFHAQAALFANAEAIIAPHGAGLANLVFCRPGTAVLELNKPLGGETWLRPWFWLIARTRGLRYAFLDASLGDVTAGKVSEALERLGL